MWNENSKYIFFILILKSSTYMEVLELVRANKIHMLVDCCMYFLILIFYKYKSCQKNKILSKFWFNCLGNCNYLQNYESNFFYQTIEYLYKYILMGQISCKNKRFAICRHSSCGDSLEGMR